MPRKNVPTKHVFKTGDVVRFKHAGRFRRGEIVELTNDPDGHATYTVMTSGNNMIYPRLGVNGSKWTGWGCDE